MDLPALETALRGSTAQRVYLDLRTGGVFAIGPAYDADVDRKERVLLRQPEYFALIDSVAPDAPRPPMAGDIDGMAAADDLESLPRNLSLPARNRARRILHEARAAAAETAAAANAPPRRPSPDVALALTWLRRRRIEALPPSTAILTLPARTTPGGRSTLAANSTGTPRIPVDLDAVVRAMMEPTVKAYLLDRRSGAVVGSHVPTSSERDSESGDPDPRLFEPIAPVSYALGLALRERFVARLHRGRSHAVLTRALRGPTPYRDFDTTLVDHPAARLAWDAHHVAVVRALAVAWLAGLDEVQRDPGERNDELQGSDHAALEADIAFAHAQRSARPRTRLTEWIPAMLSILGTCGAAIALSLPVPWVIHLYALEGVAAIVAHVILENAQCGSLQSVLVARLKVIASLVLPPMMFVIPLVILWTSEFDMKQLDDAFLARAFGDRGFLIAGAGVLGLQASFVALLRPRLRRDVFEPKELSDGVFGVHFSVLFATVWFGLAYNQVLNAPYAYVVVFAVVAGIGEWLRIRRSPRFELMP